MSFNLNFKSPVMKLVREATLYRHNWNLLLALIIIVSTCVYGFMLTREGPAIIDEPILRWFRDDNNVEHLAGPAWITKFWLFLTWLGDTTPRIIVALLSIIVLLVLRRWRNALFIIGVLLSGIALSTVLKSWIGRPRPQLVKHLDHVSSMSFPSGHAINSTLFYLVIALIVAPLIAKLKIRYSLYVLAFTLSIATGVSRIALGVHWPTDVIAGWLIAATWVFLWVEMAKHYWPKALH